MTLLDKTVGKSSKESEPDFMDESFVLEPVAHCFIQGKFDYTLSIPVVPSFNRRFNALLSREELSGLERDIAQTLWLVPQCVDNPRKGEEEDYYSMHRFRTTGDNILKMFENYADIDISWIKEILGVLNNRRWRGPDHEDRPQHKLLALSKRLLTDDVKKIAKKYSNRQEEVRKAVAGNILDAASGYYSKEIVPIMIDIYTSLSSYDLEPHTHEQVGRFFTESYYTYCMTIGRSDECDRKTQDFFRYIKRFANFFRDAEQLENRKLSPEYWVVLGEMVAYEKAKMRDVKKISEDEIINYRTEKHRKFVQEKKELVGKGLEALWSILYFKYIWKDMDVEKDHINHYFNMNTIKPDENVSGKLLMRRMYEAEVRLERFADCFTDKSYRRLISRDFGKEQRVLAASMLGDSVGTDMIDGTKTLDFLFDLKKKPYKLTEYAAEKEFPIF